MEVFKANEKLTPYFESSAGFVFFNEVFKGGLKVGGAYGLGQVYKLENDTQTNVGSCKMIQVSLGWQIGGQILSEIVFFEDRSAVYFYIRVIRSRIESYGYYFSFSCQYFFR